MGERHLDGTGWEEQAGYARAAREGTRIAVSGTTAHGPDGAALYPGDTYRQTRHCLDRALRAVRALGGRTEDVLRTRVYLVEGADWRAAARAHAEVFGAVRPANTTLFVHRLVGDGFLVEVEVDAEVGA
jgi:enamine deaminase RidA (YjgF/YER057c/UK114 family)